MNRAAVSLVTDAAMPVSISVVFPMYNEKEYVRESVSRMAEVLASITDDYEIIIVDDASSDGSQVIADDLAKADSRIRVIHSPKNRKLGGTLKAGFAAARKELVLYSDIDMPFDYAQIRRALCVFKETHADALSAYRVNRWVEGVRRTAYSAVYNIMIFCFFGLRIKDVNFAFKIFKREALNQITLFSEGSFISAETLIKLKRNRRKIVQIGAQYCLRSRGISRLSTVHVIAKIMYEAFLFRLGLQR